VPQEAQQEDEEADGKPQGCGVSEGKIVTKENHQGFLSCMIISFENFFEVSKLAAAGQKGFFDTLKKVPAARRELFLCGWDQAVTSSCLERMDAFSARYRMISFLVTRPIKIPASSTTGIKFWFMALVRSSSMDAVMPTLGYPSG
jgi:hypothetical protein